jgi:ATPase family associated with various cellular activities (AAA)
MASASASPADERPELADAGRLARKLVQRAVRTARTQDQALRAVLLDHLGPDAATLPTVSDTVPLYEQVNLQVGLEAWLAASPARSHDVIGVTGVQQIRFNDVTIGDFVQAPTESAYGRAGVGAPVIMSLPSGPDGQTRPTVAFGIYLVRDGATRLAIMLRPAGLGVRHTEVNVQVVGTSMGQAEAALREIRQLANERSVFRGQMITFGPEVFGPATGSTPLNFLPRPSVTRDQLVLPDELLADIERQVAGVAAHSRRLLASGQHLKRGVLLYGAPGTGKTHTVRYLLSQLPEVTVIEISGRALGRIREACSVARSLQPAIIVVEDVDLIAEERTARPGEHPLLFQLLNEMDGLVSAADVTFLLTTNRADLLEPALAARPGRIDLAAELPLPDAGARRALLRLYQGNLIVADADLAAVIERTEGVTAPFLRELLRKAALLSVEADSGEDDARGPAGDPDAPIAVSGAHLTAALDALFDSRRQLTRVLLGGARGDGGREPSMRAVAGGSTPGG